MPKLARKQLRKQAKIRKDKRAPLPAFVNKRLSEGLFITGLSIALYILLSLLTYSVLDSSWSHSGLDHRVINAGGRVGAYVSDILLLAFGYLAYLLPLLLLYGAWQLLKEQQIKKNLDRRIFLIRGLGFVAFLLGLCGLVSLEYGFLRGHLPYTAGGIVGSSVATALGNAFSPVGALLLLVALILVGVTLLTGLSWLSMTDIIGQYSIRLGLYLFAHAKQAGALIWGWLKKKLDQRKSQKESRLQIHRLDERLKKPKYKRKTATTVDAEVRVESPHAKDESVSSNTIEVLPKADLKKSRAPIFHAEKIQGMPSIGLLDPAEKASGKGYTNQQLEAMSRDVEQRLMDFGVMVQVVAVHPGPVITRFELQLAPGVKVSKITALAKDLARSLSVFSVRVVEVIPGKTVVGLELPNQHREMVRLSEVLATEHYAQAHSPLSLALGVDISGHPVIVDLAKMPHLLVAGTTGSGKSVGLNAMLLSLIFKSTPDQVRLILVDPKMLELAVYDGIPHLLTPVVTDMKEAASALRWSVGEMERRYRLMASLGVRNLSGYNNKVKEAIEKGEPIKDPLWQTNNSIEEEAPTLTPLPYVVVVIDELADMMMVVGKKVEQLIARIAQKARAAGIHLILATQRPSVDVLTGLIKSNVPTRMSFQVSSKIDSRTILDQQGAEQLLGHGDMLYLAPGTGAPMRVHGAFVDDKEVHRVTDEWRLRGQPQYIDDITDGPADGSLAGVMGGGDDTEDSDPLYDEAVNFVIETRKASISSVQRRLKVGYNRAARLIEEMERTGIVSAMSGSGAREVLVPSQSGE